MPKIEENSGFQELLAKLSPKRARFVQEYLIDLNGTQAAIRAGYSKKTAEQQASRLLTNVKLKAAIEAGQENIAKNNQITVDRILQEEKSIAYSDFRQLFNGETTIAPEDLPEEIARAVSGVKVNKKDNYDNNGKITETITTFEYKFWDKGRSLERLEKHLGMFEKDNKQKQPALMADKDLERELAELRRDLA